MSYHLPIAQKFTILDIIQVNSTICDLCSYYDDICEDLW